MNFNFNWVLIDYSERKREYSAPKFSRLFFLSAPSASICSTTLFSPILPGRTLVLGYIDGGKSFWNVENGEKLLDLAGAAPSADKGDNIEEEVPLYEFNPDSDDESNQSGSVNQSASDAQKTVTNTVQDSRIHKSEVCGLGWSQDQKQIGVLAKLAYSNRIADVLPPLKYFDDLEDGTALPAHQRHQSLILGAQSANLNVLLSYDTSGDIVLTAHGIFSLGRLNALELLQNGLKNSEKWSVR